MDGWMDVGVDGFRVDLLGGGSRLYVERYPFGRGWFLLRMLWVIP